MMIGLGIIVGFHPKMSLLPLHHQHFKRVRKELRLLLLNSVAFWLKPLSVQGSGSGIPQTWLVHERRQVGNGL